MPAIIRVVDERTIIKTGENSALAVKYGKLAEQFANEAELSADAAAIAAAAVGVYTTVGDGEAATTNGQSFYVASGGEVTLYINNAGTGDEVASLVTASALASTAPGEGAELVAYQQSGTGSVAGDLADKVLASVDSFEFMTTAIDGVTDNTADIQRMINASVGRKLTIHPGEYRLAISGLQIPSNSHIEWLPGAVFKTEDTSAISGMMLAIEHAENVTLINPVLDGNQAANTSTDPGVVYGIRIRGTSKRIRVLNPVTNNFYTDGINIVSFGAGNNPDDVYILNHRADRCRRQGMSIVSGSNITVENPIWSNIGIDEINGYIPGAGCDIEPAASVNIAKNIKIISPTTINCKVGIIVDLHYLTTGVSLTNEADVTIIDPIDYGSNRAFAASAMRSAGAANTGLKRGKITLVRPQSHDCGAIPFVLAGIPGVCPIEIIRPYVSEPNVSGAIGLYSAVFFISGENDATSVTTGGVHIIEPTVHAKDTAISRLWTFGAQGADVAECSLTDPLYIEPSLITNAFVSPHALTGTKSMAFMMSDIRRTCVRQMTTTDDLTLYPPPHSEITTAASRTITLPLAQSSYNHPIEFRWMPGSVGATLTFQTKAGESIAALGAGMTKIRATAHGSTITFEQLAVGVWAIKSKSGQWEEVA